MHGSQGMRGGMPGCLLLSLFGKQSHLLVPGSLVGVVYLTQPAVLRAASSAGVWIIPHYFTAQVDV